MAYKRTTWENGVTPINAANLNNIENGIVEAKTEVRPFEAGGTNANTAAVARQNINFIGTNPIASPEDDTPANWIAFGTGVAFISTSGKLKNQPVAYGYLENYTDGNYIYQAIHSLNDKSTVWSRSGTKNDWYTNSVNWVKQLDENNGIQMKKLWQNASPTSSFAEQTINVNLDGYTHYFVEFSLGSSESYSKLIIPSAITPVNKRVMGLYVWGDLGTVAHRSMTDITSNSIIFGKGYYNKVNNNEAVIPQAIYGIKGVQ